MPNTYELFEVRFLGAGPNRYDVEVSCDLVGEARGVFFSPANDPVYRQLAERLQALDTDEAMLIQLGRLLFDTLFQGDIRAAYSNAQALLSAEQGLRLSLSIDPEQAEIAQLPWEFLCDPSDRPLVMLNTPIVRYLRMFKRPPVLEAPRPMNVLVTAAATAPRLEVEHELREIRAALSGLEQQQLVNVHIEEHITRRTLQRLLRQEFQIWHFIGHGALSPNRTSGMLLFEDEAGEADACDARELSILLEESGLQVVILNACSSAQITTTAYGSIAPALMRTDVGAVIAMQFKLPQEAADPFAGEFYRALVSGAPIDACVTEGRKAIMGASGLRNPDWGIPVVYTRAPSGQLFKTTTLPPLESLHLSQEAPLPAVTQFVGRTDELVRYGAELRRRHLVVVSGIPGVGKSMFGLALANTVAPPGSVFWFTLSNIDGVDTLIRQLAAFLARRGNPTIWAQLESARANNIAPPGPSVLLDQLRQALRDRSFLLCIDDIHLASDDPLIKRFGEFIAKETAQGSFDCIIISRNIPLFINDLPLGPLPGLNQSDTRQFLRERGLELPEPALTSLHAKTGGNVTLLILALNALRETDNLARSIAQLEENNDIERYLFREVDATLSEAEREIMQATSILFGDIATRELIETLCNGRRVKRDILNLNDRFLLDVAETEAGEMYRPQAMVQAFYYDELSKKERINLHQCAAAYYEEEDHDLLRAAIHYQRGGAAARAAALATENILALINNGQSLGLVNLLEAFTADQLDQQQWIKLLMARGSVYVLQRRQAQARQDFLEALRQLASLPATPSIAEAKARVYCNLGELVRTQKPSQALEWLQQGIATLNALGDDELSKDGLIWKGRLLQTIGVAHNDAGQYDLAAEALLQALEILPDEPTQWRGSTLNNLGNVYLCQGDLEKAHEYYDRARSIYEQFKSYWRIAMIWLNLGLIEEQRGRWDAAAEQYQNALALAKSTADVADQMLAELNLGNLLAKRGDIEASLTRLQEALELARSHQLDGYAAGAQSSLADLHVRLGDWEHVAPLAQEAEQMAAAANADYVLPEVYRSLAQAQADQREGLRLALCSLKAARRLRNPREIGMSLRVVGAVRLAGGQARAALTRFERSLAILEGCDVYETARTQLTLAGSLQHDHERQAQLLDTARKTFEQLGARLDIEHLDGR